MIDVTTRRDLKIILMSERNQIQSIHFYDSICIKLGTYKLICSDRKQISVFLGREERCRKKNSITNGHEDNLVIDLFILIVMMVS